MSDVVRYFIVMLTLMCVGKVYADSSALNLSLPQSPSNYASDQIRAGDIDCRNAIGSSTNVEFGVVGIINQDDPFNSMGVDSNLYNTGSGKMKDVGVYAKITIPIGAPKERINCNTLYQLELTKKRLEVQRLQAELANLRKLKFEGDKN